VRFGLKRWRERGMNHAGTLLGGSWPWMLLGTCTVMACSAQAWHVQQSGEPAFRDTIREE
jgi:hypothetical protein